jgi:hypothetical protein
MAQMYKRNARGGSAELVDAEEGPADFRRRGRDQPLGRLAELAARYVVP